MRRRLPVLVAATAYACAFLFLASIAAETFQLVAARLVQR